MPYRKVKPMPNEKVERNRLLCQYQVAHPEATYRDIGKEFLISAQRAHQIVKKCNGLLKTW